MSQSASSLPTSAPTVTVTEEVTSGGSSESEQRRARNAPLKSNSVPDMSNALEDEDSNSASDASQGSTARESSSSKEKRRPNRHTHHGHHGSGRAHKKLDEISSDMRTRRHSSRSRPGVSGKSGRPRYDEAYLRFTIKRLREERDTARRENHKLLKDFEKLNSLLLK
mmetsp:Transcript_20919/g.23319  ORF Transcript_20919/g.23319 Transcript_20919/m.23319 type:complete len:167 (+) Transcript_20919:501-1001(+)